MFVGLKNTNDNISTSNNEELSHYLEEVVSSEAWTCDSPRYETITDRDPPPTPDDQEIHHSVPKATPKSLGQSNYKDNIYIVITYIYKCFFGMLNVPSKPICNSQKIIIYKFCMTIMLLEQFITKHFIVFKILYTYNNTNQKKTN